MPIVINNEVLQCYTTTQKCCTISKCVHLAYWLSTLPTAGKVVYIGLLGVITCEIVTVARYWTWMWGAAVLGSYLVVFPFVLLYPRIQTVLGVVDPSWCAVDRLLLHLLCVLVVKWVVVWNHGVAQVCERGAHHLQAILAAQKKCATLTTMERYKRVFALGMAHLTCC